jgi:diguanylate cyclase (GGDEF)-like protein
MKNFLTWFEDYEIEKTVFRLMLRGVVVVAFLMASFDWLFYSKTLAFLEVSFALISMALLYFTLNKDLGYVFSTRVFIFVMALPIYWNLLYNESNIESTVLFIFLPIIAGILRPIKEVIFLGVLLGGSFLYISIMELGNTTFTYMEIFKLVSTQALISFFVIIYVQTNRKYQEVISQQSTMLQEANKNLEVLYKEKEIEASTDHLTGLKNRAALMTQFEYLHARYKRQREVFSFIIIDVDKFKEVNDTYGHQKGDEVLVRVSELILDCIREVDTAARYGGEEFVVTLPQTNAVAATHIAERIRVSMEENIKIEGKSVTASFGVSEIDEGLSIDDMIKKADQALYEAKESGRNKVICA